MTVSTIQEKRILELWLKRPAHKRTGNDVLVFYYEVKNLIGDLGPGDPYQEMHSMLRGHISD